MKILHRSETIAERGSGRQISQIDVTLSAHDELARILVVVDHSYKDQSYAIARLVRNDAIIMQYAGAACGNDAKVVAADLIAKTEAALKVLVKTKSERKESTCPSK